jgi:hypothetical protein
MEMNNVHLKDIEIDPPAEELANSEEAWPYLDCIKKATVAGRLQWSYSSLDGEKS